MITSQSDRQISVPTATYKTNESASKVGPKCWYILASYKNIVATLLIFVDNVIAYLDIKLTIRLLKVSIAIYGIINISCASLGTVSPDNGCHPFS